MLRVNLMEDESFRKDIIATMKGVLREVARDTIGNALKEEGWLKKQFDEYLKSHPIGDAVSGILRSTKWHENPQVVTAIRMFIDERLVDLRRQIVASVNEDLRRIVRLEMASGLKVEFKP